ncbi:MAG: hypothetical protein FWH41_01915 [Treponema sp.]|nr:hypothetical protein [Treponema sp.]
MIEKNNIWALWIKNKILSCFPYAGTVITFDKEQNEYFVSTPNKDLYYSESYGLIVFEINQTLWNQGIFNFYFTLESDFHMIDKIIPFLFTEERIYSFWGINNNLALFVDKDTNMDNFSLAA